MRKTFWPWLSTILITTVILAPAVHLSGMIYVLFQIRRGRQTHWTARIFRVVEQFQVWGMAEVFVLGIIVAYVKLASMAVVVPGPSLYSLGAFILVAAAALTSLDPGIIWEAMGNPSAHTPPRLGAETAHLEPSKCRAYHRHHSQERQPHHSPTRGTDGRPTGRYRR